MRISDWSADVCSSDLLVQVFIIYYGLPSIGISFEPLTAGVLALSLNAGAYISESLRGAIIGITRGQWSAGYSLGLTYSQNLYYVVLPQALRLAVPSMSNTLIRSEERRVGKEGVSRLRFRWWRYH